MSLDSGGEARFEVVLAQAILNEVKYGVETNQIAEVTLLAAFTKRMVGEKLVDALQLLMPGLKYLSIGAMLRDGVIIKTSNLAVEGPVELRARSLRGSAARVAARKLTAFHTKRRPDETRTKYYELQDAWDVAQATSVLTVPIPAVRRYESASITDEIASGNDRGGDSCHVLHPLSRAVGVVNFGLSTEDIHLEGRQGKAFQGLASSLAPFLAHYAEPVLKDLEPQIQAVAKANAASIAKVKAGEEDAHSQTLQQEQQQQIQQLQQQQQQLQEQQQLAQQQAASVVASPFSAASYPSARSSSDNSQTGEDQGNQRPAEHASPGPSQHLSQASASSAPSSQKPGWQAWSAAPNPFAQAAGTAFTDAAPEKGSPGSHPSPRADHPQRPISPFAASAKVPEHASSSQHSGGGRPVRAGSPSTSRLKSSEGSNASPRPRQSRDDRSSMENARSSSSVEEGPGSDPQLQTDEFNFDSSFVFKRKPVSMAHTRRYSTSTFFQGVCYTPSQHFSHFSTMDNLPEESTESSISHTKEILVDDHTYSTTSSHFGRRALSTPEIQHSPESRPASLVHQMRTRSTCADELLTLNPSVDIDPWDPAFMTTHSAPDIHLHRPSPEAAQRGAAQRGTSAKDARPHRLSVKSGSDHIQADPAMPSTAERGKQSLPSHAADSAQHGGHATAQHEAAAGFVQRASEPKQPQSQKALPPEPALSDSLKSWAEEKAGHSVSQNLDKVKDTLKDATHQSLVWLTFSDTTIEARYAAWFHEKIFKVDTIFMLAAIVYITQMFTRSLMEQQALKWPLVGYVMVPLLVLQRGDPAWYMRKRSYIVGALRVGLHAFLAYFVCHNAVETFKWLDMGGLAPLCIIPMGLMVQFKLHTMLHAVSCVCVLMMGLVGCPDAKYHTLAACFTRAFPGVALASVAPSLMLYMGEALARKAFIKASKVA